MSFPVRSGEHSQTAFALGLALDYARRMKNIDFAQLIEEHSLRFFSSDKAYQFHYKPSGENFLSAGLAEADLLRRILPSDEFLRWFDEFLPPSSLLSRLEPPTIADPTDSKLIHLAGLALSRAWMLQGIVHCLPDSDQRRQSLEQLGERNAQAGLSAIDENQYGGGHWLGTFAIYLITQRGMCIQ